MSVEPYSINMKVIPKHVRDIVHFELERHYRPITNPDVDARIIAVSHAIQNIAQEIDFEDIMRIQGTISLDPFILDLHIDSFEKAASGESDTSEAAEQGEPHDSD